MSAVAARRVGDWLTAQRDLDRLDREVLACRALAISRAQLLARPERSVDGATLARLDRWAGRRRAGEPIAYILGEREFWGLEFAVTPAVLIPRPETERLVEIALERLTGMGSSPLAVLELGTGSGAVAVALAVEARRLGLDLQITASDVAPASLAVARDNARRHNVAVDFLEGDWFQPVTARFHLVVSNPPYIAEDDPHLDALNYEPRAALTAGADGLDALRTIATGAADHLHGGGALIVEHGYDQGPAVRQLLVAAGFTEVASDQDLAGLERITSGRRGENRS